MNGFAKRQLIIALGITGMLGVAGNSFASGFQLWEQDGASVGNYHAGYAALAEDASTAFYNPAGITRIKNQQLVLSGDGVMTALKYQGTIGVNTILAGTPQSVTAQGGNFGFVPALHYVAPINDYIGFGFSVDVPFGLKTTYGRKTIIRYAATTTSATVVDISPSLGFQLTEKASIGLGFDIQRMYAEFDQVGGLGFPTVDAESVNKVNDTGYGCHLGALYQFSSDTRMGLSYHSQVVHHLNGSSSFVGPLATIFAGGPYSSHAYSNITLPAYTALSGYRKITPEVAIMASAIYTQWNIFKITSIHNASGIQGLAPSRTISVAAPQFYNNTWNFSVGADYQATDKIKLRTGIGYDQTPTNDANRNITLPDNKRHVLAVGGHHQSSKAPGSDLGWSHFMVSQTSINPPPLVSGDQSVTTNGKVNGGADVLAAQLTWNIE